MQIFVRAQETHVVDVDSDTTAWDVKCLLESREGLSPNSLLLKFAGQPLEDEVQLSSFLLENVTVDATVRLPGGKVHGSLARAGKVKGQTPKVEKQEKKKKRTGRAKRRMQYNRRFVNVVATFGRRRGPNSNQ
ncbi:ubiquitin-like FUBI-ribosomal protein eS30 fusion protein [Corticium candelabrum]|uniref:ubiquitin-like FUBI-ribosomal protein eS30 fusion protein n=1 Tax=Corticium candelabrum TaxID=121492 RepID=UPI002E253B8B|nr:ubiquitin-like FUBI-ribosomal protein eS30 fusion protein [Corticium candelabrum]